MRKLRGKVALEDKHMNMWLGIVLKRAWTRMKA